MAQIGCALMALPVLAILLFILVTLVVSFHSVVFIVVGTFIVGIIVLAMIGSASS